jgi:hypothetical protein
MSRGKDKSSQRPDPFRDEQPAGYHYSRQDRLDMASAPRFRDPRGGIFRRNRTLLIILLDLVIILILAVFLVRFLYARVNRANLEGCSVALRGVRTEEVVLATLTIERTASSEAGQQTVFVRFSLERNPDQEESTYISGMAPQRKGEERILRAAIPVSAASASSGVLYAEVRIGESRSRLSAGLEDRGGGAGSQRR